MKKLSLWFFICYCISFSTSHVFADQPSCLKYFNVEGKVAFSHGREGGNASFTWEQKASHYAIRLFGALGAGTIEIYGRPGFVGLVESNGKTHTEANPEFLIKKILGWNIPVSPLQYWLQGLAVPGTKFYAKRDHQNRLVLLQQQGWTIHYQQYTFHQNGHWLPSRMTLENKGIRLRFIFKRWDT